MQNHMVPPDLPGECHKLLGVELMALAQAEYGGLSQGLQPQHGPVNVFSRFFSSHGSRDTTNQHAGLGLSVQGLG